MAVKWTVKIVKGIDSTIFERNLKWPGWQWWQSIQRSRTFYLVKYTNGTPKQLNVRYFSSYWYKNPWVAAQTKVVCRRFKSRNLLPASQSEPPVLPYTHRVCTQNKRYSPFESFLSALTCPPEGASNSCKYCWLQEQEVSPLFTDFPHPFPWATHTHTHTKVHTQEKE